MQIRWPLLLWMFRPLTWLTIVFSTGAACFTLFSPDPILFGLFGSSTAAFVIPFVVLHAFLISRLIGRVRSESFAFLYSQGLPRDVLWRHVWLASTASAGITLLPSAVLLLTPLRGMYQDFMLNPWYPFMAVGEWMVLVWAIAGYAVVLPIFHYEWIRSAYPYRGITSGHFLAIGFFVFASISMTLSMSQRTPLFDLLSELSIIGFSGVSAGLLVLGYRLHREVEVRS